VSLQRAYLNFVFNDMLFAITGKLGHDGTVSGERSLEAIECKFIKNEHLCISALQVQVASLQLSEMERGDKKSRFLTAILLLAAISKSGFHGECKQRCIRRGILKPTGSCW
jgi:hypothetical protein